MNELFSQLTARGYKGCVVSIQHLSDLQREIECHFNQKLLDKELYQSYLAEFTYTPPGMLPRATSIILVAVPQPKIRITFTSNGQPVQFIVPPTYGERKKERRVRDHLKQIKLPRPFYQRSCWQYAAVWLHTVRTISPTFPEWEVFTA